ncbi:MAG: carbohydrate kinase [Lachnospiraceae bacterium]|jgi:fructokinase|nr:carbohydrate kinase [Lachnospiraceae bacterium]MCI1656238.1 carbohydrate kinase [Lachnospiraceae bacterium]MCI2194720.1 carbohydrate kinase [Lachnospiraceae bacterium]
MKQGLDVLAVGELLIDFTEAGKSAEGMRLFEQNPGGAPANLLTAVTHMGHSAGLIGKIGADMHGDFLKEVLQREKIVTDYLRQDPEVFTTLAFVALNEEGEREFSFARKPGADTCLRTEELPAEALADCRIFHFGSLSLTDEPARTATAEALRMAKEGGALISFDPNYRASLWRSPQEAAEAIRARIPQADLMKVSDEESLLLTGASDYETAARQILSMGPRLVAVTLGAGGALLVTGEICLTVPGYPAQVADTTGAGDSFWGGFLSAFLETGKTLQELNRADCLTCVQTGNAVASLCVRKRGGIPAIPDRTEVENLLKQETVE